VSSQEKSPVTRLSVDEATRIAMADAAKHGVTQMDFVCFREIEAPSARSPFARKIAFGRG